MGALKPMEIKTSNERLSGGNGIQFLKRYYYTSNNASKQDVEIVETIKFNYFQHNNRIDHKSGRLVYNELFSKILAVTSQRHCTYRWFLSKLCWWRARCRQRSSRRRWGGGSWSLGTRGSATGRSRSRSGWKPSASCNRDNACGMQYVQEVLSIFIKKLTI